MAGDEKRLTESIARLDRHDQEHAMTSPTQRRHDEILGRLDALIDAVKPGDKQPAPEPVDPDDTEAYLTGKRAPDQTEQLAARVLDLEADVERLTRERDEALARCERLSVLAERGERYEALRADVDEFRYKHCAYDGTRELDDALARDDERAKGEQR